MCRTVTNVNSTSDLPRNWSLIYGAVPYAPSVHPKVTNLVPNVSPDSSDEEEEELLDQFHKLGSDQTEDFCRWMRDTQDPGLPQKMLEEYEKRRASQASERENNDPSKVLTSCIVRADCLLIPLLRLPSYFSDLQGMERAVLSTSSLVGLSPPKGTLRFAHRRSLLNPDCSDEVISMEQGSTTQEVALYEHPSVDGLYFIDTPGK